jgi:O-antigen/teichoic acid export membrane protein
MMGSLEPTQLPRFRHGLLANFAGAGWSALMQLVCIPLYIKFMGIEAFGLIGFYLVFQAITQVLDLGLSPTMNREMARYSVQPERAAEARDLVRTVEAGYWVIGLAIATIFMGASTWIATHWIRANVLPLRSIREALLLMGVLAFFQWPLSFYQGGLMGLHRQVLFNIVRIGIVTLNGGGAVLILWLVSPTIQAFLLWQIAVNAVQAVVLAVLLWKCLPATQRAPRFEFSLVRNIGRFAAGVGGITLIGLALTQIDKVVVSKLLSLTIFGYYILASAAANSLSIIAAVIFNVIFPRMSAQVAAGDENGVRQSYHTGSQLMAVLVLPLAVVLSFFSFDVMHLWTRNIETASFAAPILRILIIGSALNALLFLPYSLQLAFGWTRLNLTFGLISMVIFIPATVLATKHFGPIGAAAVWVAINVLNMLVVVPIMHKRILPHEAWGYFRDVGLPMLAVIVTAALGRLVLSDLSSWGATIAALASIWIFCQIVSVLVAPLVRSWALAQASSVKLLYIKRAGSLG